MHCEEIEALLDPYLDGEMTLSDTRMLELHMINCHRCDEKLKEHNALREAIINISEEVVTRKLRRDIDKQLDNLTDDDAEKQKWKWWSLSVGGMVFGSAITAMLLMVILELPIKSNNSEAFVNAHINSLIAGHITDVTSTDKHTVKPWFSGKLSFSPSVHRIDMKDLELVGGRLDYINKKSAASIVYKVRAHTINVFIQRTENDQDNTSLSVTRKSSYNIVSWKEDGLLYHAISDLNTKELTKFSQAFLKQ